jgi:sugar/nucleoside kinase (ribokinase family)
MSVLCIGELLIDFTPVGGMDHSYTANPGGAPANVAVSISRNGIRSGFLGKLGNDDFGRFLKRTMEDNDVELLCPELTDKATTTMAFVTLDASGDRSFTFARKPGADLLLDTEDVRKVDISSWDIVHAGSVSQSGLPERDAVLLALSTAKELGKIVSFDINFRDKIWSFEECSKEVTKILPLTDLLKISEEELEFVGGRDNIPSVMREYGIAVVVLTSGGDGSQVFFEEESKVFPSMSVPVTDTTGAGDAYWGGFLSSLLLQGIRNISDITWERLSSAARYGTVSAGLSVQEHGGIPSLPTRSEIEKLC